MDESLEKKIREAIADPKNMGELADADRVGTVGNSDCGEMLRLWVKFKEDHGRKVIDQASFQSFGCETAIAVASMATELIRGKTADEALALRHDELTGDLGALPPMKIHCAQLVEGALKAALDADEAADKKTAPAGPTPPRPSIGPARRRRISMLSIVSSISLAKAARTLPRERKARSPSFFTCRSPARTRPLCRPKNGRANPVSAPTAIF